MPGDSGTESRLGEPRLRGGGTSGLRGAFTTGVTGCSSSTPGAGRSLCRARASSCACARLSAVCNAITLCLSAVSRHFSHVQYRYLQYRLCPFSSTLSRWFLQRAQLGGARGTAELEAPGSERSSQSSGTRRLQPPPIDTISSCSAVFAVDLARRERTARRAVTMRLIAAGPRSAPPRPAPLPLLLHLLLCTFATMLQIFTRSKSMPC